MVRSCCHKHCRCFSEVLFKDGVVFLLYQDMQYVPSVQLKYLHVWVSNKETVHQAIYSYLHD